MAKITHFGVLVRDIDAAISKWSQLFGFKLIKRLAVEQERVKSAFLSPDGDWRGFMIELVEPMDPEDMDNTVSRRLKEHGEGVLHMCMAVDDIAEIKGALQSAGVRMVARESVTETGDERLILSPRSVNGVMVEVMSGKEWSAVWKG